MKNHKETALDFEIDIDDHDFVFVNKALTAKEEKEFSDFLKSRKSRLKTKKTLPARTRRKKALDYISLSQKSSRLAASEPSAKYPVPVAKKRKK